MKKEKTFADRAKAIRAKYSRSEWDMLERKDMMAELSKLKEEQEQVRAAMGIADYADQQDQGQEQQMQEQQFDGYNNSQYLPKNYFSGYQLPQVSSVPSYNSIPRYNGSSNTVKQTSKFVPQKVGISNIKAPTVGKGYGNWSSGVTTEGLQAGPKMQYADTYQSSGTSAWPSLISAGMSMVGDIAGMVNANKNMPKSVALPRVAPYNINLQPQREALQRGYNTASNTILRNSRDVSSPANAYANQIAGVSGLMDSYGTQMGQSYMNEMNANSQMGQQRNMANAEIGSQEALQNARLQQTNAQITGQYINSLAETIPSAMRDYRQQVNQDNMINTMGREFGYYSKINPNENAWQAFVRQMFGDQKYVVNKNSPLINNGR